MLKDYLDQNNITIYELSKRTKISYATLNYIANGKINIKKTSVEKALKIADVLNITVEKLCEVSRRYTASDFEWFKSNTCHRLKSKGVYGFLIEILESSEIEDAWERGRKEEALYLLSMVDYLSRLEGIPLCSKYHEIRRRKIEPTIMPLGYKLTPDSKDYSHPIKEFLIHGIFEGDIFDVC